MKEFVTDGVKTTGCVSDVTVTVPCIRNTEDIAPSTGIVLEWKGKRETQGTQPKAARVITAFTEGAPKKKQKS